MGQVTLEQAIVEAVRKLDDATQQRVLDIIQSLAPTSSESEEESYAVDRLMRLPYEERQREIQRAFDLAAEDEFETFSVNY